MLENWWKAHELEVWFAVGLFALAAIIWLCSALSAARRERKAKRDAGIL